VHEKNRKKNGLNCGGKKRLYGEQTVINRRYSEKTSVFLMFKLGRGRKKTKGRMPKERGEKIPG
jgi:hypothetical protein